MDKIETQIEIGPWITLTLSKYTTFKKMWNNCNATLVMIMIIIKVVGNFHSNWLETWNFHKNFTTLKSVTPRSWREMTPQHFFYQKMSSKKNHWCFRHPRISLESLPKSLLINVHARHIVWKLLKMSHFNFGIFHQFLLY